jgi:DNA-binding PadR family transcriptional regulator
MKKTEINLWELAVLALLREAPMHPYQMRTLLRQRHKDEFLVLKRGSLYHAINRLVLAGSIKALSSERNGRRPERTIYEITPYGDFEVQHNLNQLISVPRRESSEFMAALSFLIQLDRKTALFHLGHRTFNLQEDIGQIEEGMKAASSHVDRINLIESEYLLAMRAAELKWVRGLLADIKSGKLDWNFGVIIAKARREREAAGAPSAEEKP